MNKKSIIKFKDIASQITGFSTPVFGISWNPPKTEKAIAKSLVNFLEDKRVLYNPTELEIPHHCIDSVIEIRDFLTEKADNLDKKSELLANIKTMRSACRKFLDSNPTLHRGLGFSHNSYDSQVFYSALGEMRGTFGICLSQIVISFGVDIEKDLAAILPTSYKD
ncbi:hypothetical protein A2382_01485 [Candidatus Woesebacteria bacterium RIFOXYB1_FULL_38_16]|uniref:Uncharacterized protein n=1 Tax=Candidatus Woesebacteria bacterium RIFOXYB1_FULL_38_16 TaxID=1802538 RepID=A0A1F8CS35_9BACT|nr:MAG: hypothetical protein A2191_01750 [Candidatus Woesebacteria bacterium RIFOXYA1_FULL_38_9]OGM79082.1 MAG: hypothetical protein A2382_01485 [Candidatus Woesebacteria bacterium RIFOXYB1_FULL_38_16]